MFVKNALIAVLAVAPAILAAPLPSATTGVAATTTTAAATTTTPAPPLHQKAHTHPSHHEEVVEDKALKKEEHLDREKEALIKAEEVVVKDRLKIEEEAASSTSGSTVHPTSTPTVPAPKMVKRTVASDEALLAELKAKEKALEGKEKKVEAHEQAVAKELAHDGQAHHEHDPSHTSSVAPTATLHRRAVDPTATPASSPTTGALGTEATGTHHTHHEFKLVMQRIVEMAKVLDKMAKDLTHDHTGKKALKDIDAMEARYVKAHAKHAAKHAEAAAAATTTSPAAAAAATQTTA